MNITLLALFASTFSLIDADIDVTKRGINYYGGAEGNPIAEIFTSRQSWNELKIVAYAGNVAGFMLASHIGAQFTNQYALVHPGISEEFMITYFQIMYIGMIIGAEIYAIGSWMMRGVPVYIKVTPLYIIF